jgi:LmbE family N-acetylglucosaminyl deacetylase
VKTLLAVLAHPDDEVNAAGSILAQRARGDRVVILWLTRGEMTEAFGALPPDEVAERRMALGAEAAGILGAEHRFLDLPDTRLEATPATTAQVARVLAEVRPDGVLTWGEGWVRGHRHPDHQACGKIARDAVTLARIAKVVGPATPWRGWAPVFAYRDVHSRLPVVGVDVEPYLDTVFELARLYREEVGFGDRAWLEERLRAGGRALGVEWGEAFEAWESKPGLVEALLPADPGGTNLHPDREGGGG